MSLNNERATGNTCGYWTEFSEQPLNHGVGYFWRRSDGLRVGYRPSGSYYKKGAVPVPIRPARYAEIGPAGYDGAIIASPESIFEGEKLECLPSHIRFMREGVEIELLTSLDGVSVDRLCNSEDGEKKVFAYADKKWPLTTLREFVTGTSKNLP